MNKPCPVCNGTGERGQYGILDCPNCTAAAERAALNAFMDSLGPMTPYDAHWAAYQFGQGAVSKRKEGG